MHEDNAPVNNEDNHSVALDNIDGSVDTMLIIIIWTIYLIIQTTMALS